MLSTPLIPKHASANRPSWQWNDDDFDVLANSEVVGRIFKANAAPVGSPWIWTLAFGHHEDRTATLQRARLPWLHSPTAGGANERKPRRAGAFQYGFNCCERALSARTRTYSRQTQRSAFPWRLPSSGTVQSPDQSHWKQAYWRSARPSILRSMPMDTILRSLHHVRPWTRRLAGFSRD